MGGRELDGIWLDLSPRPEKGGIWWGFGDPKPSKTLLKSSGLHL